MKKLLVGAFLIMWLVALVPAVAAAPGDDKSPTHGCDQADENDGDVYDSTCDGSPSGNGNGGGNANGKACAGCEGAADNKNPQGQMPNAEDDGNNGYECDGNSGIARGNPAHSACEPYSGAAAPDRTHKISGKNTNAFLFDFDAPAEKKRALPWLFVLAAVGLAFMMTGSHLWNRRP